MKSHFEKNDPVISELKKLLYFDHNFIIEVSY